MFKKFISILFILMLFLNIKVSATRIEDMSLDEKIGQMLCLDFRFWNNENLKQTKEFGITSSNKKTVQIPVTKINNEIKQIISNYHIGNIILFSQNFVDKEQSKKLIYDLQKTAEDSGNLPLIIATDQEGGKVERFAFDRKKFKNNADIKTSKEAFEKGKAIAKELKELGINCNFAPVVDVNSNPKNPVINVRSFGSTPKIVSDLGQNFLDGLHSENIMGTAKHFPGHGDTNVDSHFGLPKVGKTLDEIQDLELKPFQTLINSGVDMIMTAHIEYPKIEPNTVISKKDGEKIFIPATLSKTILTNLLRKKMGFNGVIITDALNMKAIADNFGEKEAAKMSIMAGADILCMPVILRSKYDIDKLDSLLKYLKTSVKNGEILESEINKSVERIIKLKEKYC